MKFTPSLLLATAPAAFGLGPQGYNIPTNVGDGLYGVVLDAQGNPQGGLQMISGNSNIQQVGNWKPDDPINQPWQCQNGRWPNGQACQNGQQQQQQQQPWICQNGHWPNGQSCQQNNQQQPWVCQNGRWPNGQPCQQNGQQQPWVCQNGHWPNGQPCQQNGQPWNGQNPWQGNQGQPWNWNQWQQQNNNGQPKKHWPRSFGAFAGRPGVTRRDSFPGSVQLQCTGRNLDGAGEMTAWNNLAGWCGDGGHTSQYSIYFAKSQGTIWYSCSKIGPQPCNKKEMTDARERFQHGCSNNKSGLIYVQAWKKTYGRAAPGDNICGGF